MTAFTFSTSLQTVFYVSQHISSIGTNGNAQVRSTMVKFGPGSLSQVTLSVTTAVMHSGN